MEYFGDRAVAKWLHSPLPGELDSKSKIFHQKNDFHLSIDSIQVLNSELSDFGTK